MQDTWTGTSTRAEPKTLGGALLTEIFASLGECIACFKAQGPEWALHPVRVNNISRWTADNLGNGNPIASSVTRRPSGRT